VLALPLRFVRARDPRPRSRLTLAGARGAAFSVASRMRRLWIIRAEETINSGRLSPWKSDLGDAASSNTRRVVGHIWRSDSTLMLSNCSRWARGAVGSHDLAMVVRSSSPSMAGRTAPVCREYRPAAAPRLMRTSAALTTVSVGVVMRRYYSLPGPLTTPTPSGLDRDVVRALSAAACR